MSGWVGGVGGTSAARCLLAAPVTAPAIALPPSLPSSARQGGRQCMIIPNFYPKLDLTRNQRRSPLALAHPHPHPEPTRAHTPYRQCPWTASRCPRAAWPQRRRPTRLAAPLSPWPGCPAAPAGLRVHVHVWCWGGWRQVGVAVEEGKGGAAAQGAAAAESLARPAKAAAVEPVSPPPPDTHAHTAACGPTRARALLQHTVVVAPDPPSMADWICSMYVASTSRARASTHLSSRLMVASMRL